MKTKLLTREKGSFILRYFADAAGQVLKSRVAWQAGFGLIFSFLGSSISVEAKARFHLMRLVAVFSLFLATNCFLLPVSLTRMAPLVCFALVFTGKFLTTNLIYGKSIKIRKIRLSVRQQKS